MKAVTAGRGSWFRPGKWHMLALAFVAENCTVGLIFGSYGTLLPTVERDFGITRGTASWPPAIAFLLLGLFSTWVGGLLRRYPTRYIMAAGATINALAAFALSLTDDVAFLLLLYALLGFGTSLMGLIAPFTLVSRWFTEGRGRALGILNTPVGYFVAPMLAAYMVQNHGLSAMYVLLSCVFLAILPLMLLITDPRRDEAPAHRAAAPASSPRLFLRDPRFWLMAIGVGVLTGGASAFVTHVVPYMTGRGIPLSTAAWVMSIYGLSGMIGTYMFGLLADAIKPVNALIVLGAAMAALWMGVMAVGGLPLLLVPIALLGVCITSIPAIHGATVADTFGVAESSRVMGTNYLVKIPFTFAAAPVVGYLFELTGGYAAPFAGVAACLVLATGLFVWMRILNRRYPEPTQ